ncbi:MAG: DUF2470 domain-containing protein [Actinomycetota bacterium]
MLISQASAAETVATLLAGVGTADLTSAVTGHRIGVLHALGPDNVPLVLTSHPERPRLGMCPSETLDVPVALEVRADAPVADLTLPRAHVVVRGWVRTVPLPELAAQVGVRCGPVTLGEAYRSWPDPWLLAVEPADVELHWSYGCTPVDLCHLRTAGPDPLAAEEAAALQRIDSTLAEALVTFVRAMGRAHDPEAGRSLSLADVVAVRAVGLDRYGVDLRCEHARTTGQEPAVARLPFPAPVSDVDEAITTLTALVTAQAACRQGGSCPYS